MSYPKGYRPPEAVLKSRSDFDKAQIDAFVDGYGERVLWESVAPCPCRLNDQTDQPDPTCEDCFGDGFVFYGGTDIRVVFNRHELTPDFLRAQGQFWGGEVIATARAETPIGYRHRLTMMDAVIEYMDSFTRPEYSDPRFGSVQKLKRPIATRYTALEKISTGQIEQIEARVNRILVRQADSSNRALVEGVDYVITSEGHIDWSEGDRLGTSVKPGETFTMSYWTSPRWIVTSLRPHPIQNIWSATKVPAPVYLQLPYTVMCQLDWLSEGSH